VRQALVLAVLAGAIALTAGCAAEVVSPAPETVVGPVAQPTAPELPAGDPAAGKDVFAAGGCGGCHVLADAGASGAVGPNLDESKPDLALVIDRVTNGSGAMPPFKDQLDEQQIADVAAYVVQATSG
jgi:mono/diheme cytochrome c family protein